MGGPEAKDYFWSGFMLFHLLQILRARGWHGYMLNINQFTYYLISTKGMIRPIQLDQLFHGPTDPKIS